MDIVETGVEDRRWKRLIRYGRRNREVVLIVTVGVVVADAVLLAGADVVLVLVVLGGRARGRSVAASLHGWSRAVGAVSGLQVM